MEQTEKRTFYIQGQGKFVDDFIVTNGEDRKIRSRVILQEFVKQDGMVETWKVKYVDPNPINPDEQIVEHDFNVPNNALNLYAILQRLERLRDKKVHEKSMTEDELATLKDAITLAIVYKRMTQQDLLIM